MLDAKLRRSLRKVTWSIYQRFSLYRQEGHYHRLYHMLWIIKASLYPRFTAV
jgi:hypothetical protein